MEQKPSKFHVVFIKETEIMEHDDDPKNSMDPLNMSNEFEVDNGQIDEAPDAEFFVEIDGTISDHEGKQNQFEREYNTYRQ